MARQGSKSVLATKTIRGWGCDCPEYPHASIDCPHRYPVVVDVLTDPEWRAPRRYVDDDVSRETDLPPEVTATPLGPSDVSQREIRRLLAVPGATGTYARGYPPGDVSYRGECPSCGTMVNVKLDGDLYKHKCITDDSAEKSRGALRPVDGTITPTPVESIVVRGFGWRAIYENGKFYEGWLAINGVWTKSGATDVKQRALQSPS